MISLSTSVGVLTQENCNKQKLSLTTGIRASTTETFKEQTKIKLSTGIKVGFNGG